MKIKLKRYLPIITLVFLLFGGVYYYFQRHPQILWKGYEEKTGFGLKGGQYLVNFKAGNHGGIRLLSENYEQEARDAILTVFDLENEESEEMVVFNDLPELTHYAAVADNIQSWVWIVQQQNSQCSTGSLEGDIAADDELCSITLWKFDVNSKDFVEQTEFKLADNLKRDAFVLPLTVSNDYLWLGVIHDLSRTLGEEQPTDILVRFNKNTQETEYYHFGHIIDRGIGSPYVDGFGGRRDVAGVDSQGNFYVIAKRPENGDWSEPKLYKLNLHNRAEQKSVDIPRYHLKRKFLFNLQLVVDEGKDNIYLVDRTWDGNQDSYFWQYDIQRGKFELIGQMPTRVDDDVRDLEVYQGKLLASFTDGLGVYQPETQRWQMIHQENGLLNNSIKRIEFITPHRFCLMHDNSQASCLQIPFPLARFLF